MKVLGPTTDFPTWGFSKGIENPQGILTLKASGVWWQNFHRTGERDSWRAQTKTCADQDPGKRSSDHKRLSQTCLWVSRRLRQRHRSTVVCRGVRDTEYNSPGISPFEGVHHYCHYSYHCFVSGQTTWKEHSPTYQQKIELKIYWAWLCPLEQDPDSPHCQSLPPGSFHKPLILVRQRADWVETTITEN